MVLGNDFLQPYVDGRVYREARSLVRAGHKVTVVCWARTITNEILRDVPFSESYDGIEVKRAFSPIAPLGSPVVIRVYQHLQAMRRLAAVISKTKTDVLHCHDFNTLFTRVFLRNFNKPLVYDSHEDFINMINEVLPGYMLWLARKTERYLLEHYVDHAISVCEPIIRSLENYGVKNTSLVMNCRDLGDYAKISKSRVRTLRERVANDNEIIVLYIGSMGGDRGLKELIDIFNDGGSDLEKIKLVLGGYGHMQERIQACVQSSSNISWVGFVPGDELIEYNLAADIMAVLFNPARQSQRVCLPNKLFEAMASSKPIIVCKGTEAARIVESEDCGLIVPYGDKSALKRAVIKLADDSKLRLRLGKNGLKAAKSIYNWGVQEGRLISIYKNLTQR
jgi:glycosyltransferase involved in cell wall biosynthesis